MAFPASFIDELVQRNPIEDVVGQYVNLKRSGGNLFGLAVLNMVVKKPLWMKLIRGASFVAACLAACPILINTQVRVIPSVFAAIVLMVLWGLSHYMVTHPEKQKEETPKGRRLAGK